MCKCVKCALGDMYDQGCMCMCVRLYGGVMGCEEVGGGTETGGWAVV